MNYNAFTNTVKNVNGSRKTTWITISAAILLSLNLIACGVDEPGNKNQNNVVVADTTFAEPDMGGYTQAEAMDDYLGNAIMEPVDELAMNTEEYEYMPENEFLSPALHPLSTFSIDVDNASYANVRRMLNQGQMPPADAVRTEEFINYFKYEYPVPSKKDVFSVYTEVAGCPWNEKNKLVHIGLQGYTLPVEELPPANLVFLVDVSGSMSDENKLPLLKQSLNLLVDKLNARDQVSLVTYADGDKVVLESTSCANKEEIR